MKNKMIVVAMFSPFLMMTPTFAQYHQQAQYNPGTVVTNSNQPVIVPPTVIMPTDQNASKKSCRQNVIDLFLFRFSTTAGDCTQ
jgi:hypothetical protein